ncbi:uncharacterized protein LOC141720970 [Apium graveolens]|uniref:uncharacterized protein LOC141720970 n=1 Tax=Apium graveolens TaxID=4045 RepID=UPI003D7BE194
MENLPWGCVFKPTTRQIFKYLNNKVCGIEEAKVNLELIPELDVYQFCPTDLQGISPKGYTYFFTRRSTKKDSVSRNDRLTKDGKGYWCASGKKKGYWCASGKKRKGTKMLKRTLVYYFKAANVKGRGQKTNWIMHEYEFKSDDEKSQANVHEKIVLCGVYDRKKHNEDTETETDEEEIQESQQKNTAANAKEETACADLIKTIDESHQSSDQHENTASTAEKELDLTLRLWPKEQIESADEKANVHKKIVLCGYKRKKQIEETETNEEEIQESQQKNTAAENKEETACADLIKTIDESYQSSDQHENTASTEEKELDLTLRLWPGEQIESADEKANVHEKIVLCGNKRKKQIEETGTNEEEIQESQQKNTASENKEETACADLIKTIDESRQSSDQHENTASIAEKELDLTLRLWPGEQIESADEKASVHEKIVLCGYKRKKQIEETETNEEEIQESQQKNTAAENKEETACADLIKTIDESYQSSDQHENTTSTAEKEMDLTLQLWPGEQK